MGQASGRIQKRRQAKKTISELIAHPDQVIVIHYSCESFHNRPDGSSPRITSIAVRHLDSGQTTSFSIHQMAERKSFNLDSLEEHFRELEKLMLDEFYEYVKTHLNYKWLHWNMRDINYGFPALSHRYKVLKGKPVELENSKLFDLAHLIGDLHGPNYIEHPRLASLVKKNNLTQQNFMLGQEEAEAFDKKQYVKLHQSTLRKANVIADIAERTADGTLKTNATWKDTYGIYPEALVEMFQEKWWIVAILGIIGIISDLLGIINILP